MRGAVAGAGALLAAACASVPTTHVGPITGRASAGGTTFTCSQAGIFASSADGRARWLGDPGIRPFALAAGPAGLLVGGGTPAQTGELVLCDLDGRARARARIADDLVYATSLAPDAGQAAAACADGRVVLVTLPDLGHARTRWSHAGPAVAVAHSPDSALLVSGGHDGVVLLGSAAGDDPPQRLVDHTAAVTCVGWSPDGKRFASGATDGKVRLHDRSGRLVHTWLRLGGPVQSVAFADGALAWTAAGPPGQGERHGELALP